ncbi:MAG: cytochrome B [Rhizobiales bacterium PAR1]|nr:MAG: cytochrome B [Rhizobiales bacterium PAR1]
MPTRFDAFSRTLHWLMAGLIFFVFAVGLIQEWMPRNDTRPVVIALHLFGGTALIGLVALRIFWAFLRKAPAEVAMPRWMALSSKAAHLLLYGFMLAVPLIGVWLYGVRGRSYSLFGVPMPMLFEKNDSIRRMVGEVHEVTAYLMMTLVILHIGAALYHHIILKDGLLFRMSGRTPSQR